MVPQRDRANDATVLVSSPEITEIRVERGNNENPKPIVKLNLLDKEEVKRKCWNLKKKETGGWKYALLLLANQGLATLSFFGVGVNLVLFLTRVLGQDNAVAANNVSKWTGTVYLFSLLGAFVSDSYLGRYFTCALFQIILIGGLGTLSVSSWLLLIKPNGCGNSQFFCNPPSRLGVGMFYLAIYMIALGYGGHQPTLATFGSDQFDEFKPKEKESKLAFFSYFYFALNVGLIFSNTILVYYEDTGKWTIGFLVSTCAATLALGLFLVGSRGYRYVKPHGDPLSRVAQVFVASAKKWRIVPSREEELYEVEGSEYATKGSTKIHHSQEFKCLDKAATIMELDFHGQEINPWRLCTVTQVEEAKCIVRMIPIWLCTIIYSVIFTQMTSLFVEQGSVMHSKIGNFHIPAASMSIFDVFSVLIFTGINRHIIVPIASRFTKNRKGLSPLQRMGIGLVIGMLAMVAAGITEMARLRKVFDVNQPSSLSIFWQVPQYLLVGASEVFMYVGQLEFFNGQAPDGIKSFGSSLCMASMSLGNYTSIVLINIVMAISGRGGRPGWIPRNLNDGHVERFYFLIAILTVVDFGIYVYCATWYKGINVDEETEILKTGNDDGVGAQKQVDSASNSSLNV